MGHPSSVFPLELAFSAASVESAKLGLVRARPGTEPSWLQEARFRKATEVGVWGQQRRSATAPWFLLAFAVTVGGAPVFATTLAALDPAPGRGAWRTPTQAEREAAACELGEDLPSGQEDGLGGVAEAPQLYIASRTQCQALRAARRANAKAAQLGLQDALLGACRALEALAQEARLVGVGVVRGEEARALARFLLVSQELEDDLTRGAYLANVAEAQAPRALAVEALDSIISELRDGELIGARQQRVLDRLRLAKDQLLEYLSCFPNNAVHAVEAVVERENANNQLGFAGIFPWRQVGA